MKKNTYFLFLVLSFGLLLNACSTFHDGKICQDKLPWKSSGDILLEENFSNPSSHWEEVNNAYEIKRYSDQGYFIFIQPNQSRTVSTSGKVFSDIKFSVDAQKVTGSRDTNYGLVCRYQDKHNYYGFSIGTDGYVGVFKVVQGETQLLSGNQFSVSDHVHQDDGVNAIIASCINDHLSLNVNGTDVLTVNDDTFSLGEAGLFFETAAEGKASGIFNHFLVVKP